MGNKKIFCSKLLFLTILFYRPIFFYGKRRFTEVKKLKLLLLVPALMLFACDGMNQTETSNGSNNPSDISDVSSAEEASSAQMSQPDSYVTGSEAANLKNEFEAKLQAAMPLTEWAGSKLEGSFNAKGSFASSDELKFDNADLSLNFEVLDNLNRDVLSSLQETGLTGEEDLGKFSAKADLTMAVDITEVQSDSTAEAEEESSSDSTQTQKVVKSHGNAEIHANVNYGRQALKVEGMEAATESDWLFLGIEGNIIQDYEDASMKDSDEDLTRALLSNDLLKSVVDLMSSSAPEVMAVAAEDEQPNQLEMILSMLADMSEFGKLGTAYYVKLDLASIADLVMEMISSGNVAPVAEDPTTPTAPVVNGDLVIRFDFEEEGALKDLMVDASDVEVAYGEMIDLNLSLNAKYAETEDQVELVSQEKVDELYAKNAELLTTPFIYVPGEELIQMLFSMLPM